MKKEFNLSEKIEETLTPNQWFYAKDVQEFIRLNDEDLQKVSNGEIMMEEAIERIKKRAGDKLSK